MTFQTDYLVSWDFSPGDGASCVTISMLSADKGKIICTVLGSFRTLDGVVSLRQLLQEANALNRNEKEVAYYAD